MKANPNLDHNTLLQLTLPPNSDASIIKNVKHIDHVAIKFEAFNQSTLLQCKNCQRFGHSAGGCQHGHRCVKCGEDHFKTDCPRTNNKTIKLVCCNCGGEHTANNIRECQEAQKIINGNKNIINNNKFNLAQISSKSSSLPKHHQNVSSSKFTDAFPLLPGRQRSDGFRNSHYINQASNSSSNYKFNNDKHSYATILTTNNANIDPQIIMNKLDVLINIVLKHEQIITNAKFNE